MCVGQECVQYQGACQQRQRLTLCVYALSHCHRTGAAGAGAYSGSCATVGRTARTAGGRTASSRAGSSSTATCGADGAAARRHAAG